MLNPNLHTWSELSSNSCMLPLPRGVEIHKHRESLKVERAGLKSRVKYSSFGIIAASSTINKLAALPTKESRLLMIKV